MLQKDDRLFFGNKSTFEVARIIFQNPSKIFHIRELERETKLSTTAISSAVAILSHYNIIKVESDRVTKKVTPSNAFTDYKLIFNLYCLTRLGLIGLLKTSFYPEAIVLFGSYARGEDNENSDIDLLIISDRTAELELNKYETQLGRKISLHVIKDLKDSTKEFKNTVANGVVLYGYLKVI